MKRIQYLLIALLAMFSVSERSSGQYLNQTTNTMTSFNVSGGCFPSGMQFDFEPVNGDATFDLDLVIGRVLYGNHNS